MLEKNYKIHCSLNDIVRNYLNCLFNLFFTLYSIAIVELLSDVVLL